MAFTFTDQNVDEIIEEEEDDRLRRKIELTINFTPFQTKTEFIIDTDNKLHMGTGTTAGAWTE